MKFEETVLTADGVVQLIFNIIIVKSMTILMSKKPRHKQEQPKEEKKHTGSKHTHTHTNTGSRGKTEHSQLTFPTLPEKHDSKERVTPE